MESLTFYWEITSRFGNWKVLYSNPSDTSSEDCKMTRPQEQQDVSASTIHEECPDETVNYNAPTENYGENNDWSKNDWSKKDDEQHTFFNSNNQRKGGLFRSSQRGRGGNQVGTSRSYGYYDDPDLYENINISEASNSPIRPKKNPQPRQYTSIWEYEPREFL